jgi:CMP-N,N'-diacetyllegionaminic acid synthase
MLRYALHPAFMNTTLKKQLHVVAIIPARGGSKTVQRKNLKKLGGIPLVAWPIRLAKSIQLIDRVIVSTEDPEILKVARKFGAETPFIRPSLLSQDDVPTLPVLQHALRYLQSKEHYSVNIVILLYPTTPFLRRERVIEGIELLQKRQYDSVVGVQLLRNYVWKFSETTGTYLQFYPKSRINRQRMKHLYVEAGNIYFSKANVLMKQHQLINQKKTAFLFVGDDEVLDIDSTRDFAIARSRVQKGLV